MEHKFLNFLAKMKSLLLLLGIATFAMENEPEISEHKNSDSRFFAPSKISIGVQCQNIESQTISLADVEISLKRECGICFDVIGDNMKKFTSDCKHLYHVDCISAWMKTRNGTTCPQCRNKIRKVQVWISREEFLQNHAPRENQNQQNQLLNEVVQQLEIAGELQNLRNEMQNQHQNQEQRQNQIQIEMQDVRNQFLNQNENQWNQFQNVLNQPNQMQNVQRGHQLVNVFFTQMGCWYFFLYLSWSILEVAIVLSYVYIPKWANLFPIIQVLNGLYLFLIWVLQCDCFGCRSKEEFGLMAPKALSLITLFLWLITLIVALSL